MNQHPSEPRWLDADEREAWLGLLGVTLLLPSLLDSQLQRDAGLTTFDYLVLAMLSEAPDRTLQLKTLARLSNGSLSRLSHTVTRLENRGWVRRETSPAPTAGQPSRCSPTRAMRRSSNRHPVMSNLVRRVVFDSLAPYRRHSAGQLDARDACAPSTRPGRNPRPPTACDPHPIGNCRPATATRRCRMSQLHELSGHGLGGICGPEDLATEPLRFRVRSLWWRGLPPP